MSTLIENLTEVIVLHIEGATDVAVCGVEEGADGAALAR
jgi:hypothetical protein